MPRSTSVQVRTYRNHRLELRDDGGTGWTVAIQPPPGSGVPPEVLRNSVPRGLNGLLEEARPRVVRRLDGTPVGSMRRP